MVEIDIDLIIKALDVLEDRYYTLQDLHDDGELDDEEYEEMMSPLRTRRYLLMSLKADYAMGVPVSLHVLTDIDTPRYL